jgi:serine/threonine protein phosphatase 1
MDWNILKQFARTKTGLDATEVAQIAMGYVQPDRRIYAIGDLHGQIELLEQMLNLIEYDLQKRPVADSIVVFLGDYVDRGHASAEVIERLASGNLPGTSQFFLCGNHEELFLDFLKSPMTGAAWLDFGGYETAQSYGLAANARRMSIPELIEFGDELNQLVPEAHKRFIASLVHYVEIDGYFFVHAGVLPGVPLSRQKPSDLLWIRDAFLNYEGNFEKVIVHGHTPRPRPENMISRINVDTGAYASQKLTSVVLENDQRLFITVVRDDK